MVQKIENLPELKCPFGADGLMVRNLSHGHQEAPVMRFHTPGLSTPLILFSDGESINRIFDDNENFVTDLGPQAQRFDSEFSPEVSAVYNSKGVKLLPVLAWANGERHTRQRRLVDKAFLPGKVEKKKQHIANMANDLIDEFPENGDVEFMQSYAMRLPTMLILRELGLPADQVDFMINVTNRGAPMIDFTSTHEQVIDGAHAISDLELLLTQRIEAVRQQPDETLLSDMVHATSDGHEPLSRDELLSTCVELLLGGSHTTMAMLGWSLHTLATRPDIAEALRQDPTQIPVFVEEILRRHNTIVTSYRTAINDIEIDGTFLPKGTQVALRLDCANRNDARWENPNAFVMGRPHARRHHAFGRGKHTCIGNGLARGELHVSVETFLNRFSSIELANPAEAPRLISSFDGHVLAELNLSLHNS